MFISVPTQGFLDPVSKYMVSSTRTYLLPLETNQGQQQKGIWLGSLLDSPSQQLKRRLLMSDVGILVMLWSLALGGNTISLGEKYSLKQLSAYFIQQRI